MESYIGTYSHRDRRKSINTWVGVKFAPARWASNFSCDSVGKINNTVDDWLSCLSIMPIRSGGRVSLPPCFTRAQNEPRAESEQLAGAPSAFPFSKTLFSYLIYFCMMGSSNVVFRPCNGN